MPDDNNPIVAVRDALSGFNGFLTSPAFGTVAEAIRTIGAQFPQINALIDQLVGLMTQLDTELDNLNLDTALTQVPTFVGEVRNLLEGATQMFDPPEGLGEALDAVEDIAEVLQQIRLLIPAITQALEGLKAPA
ncbi:MAG TPA: hypothetical protein VEX86_07835 [Longimicrobium sp.]|nr:hypothetical protein [Longimicrobium sp.]